VLLLCFAANVMHCLGDVYLSHTLIHIAFLTFQLHLTLV